MTLPAVSKRKADIFAFLAFVLVLVISYFTYPRREALLVALMVAIIVRQFVRGRLYDILITLAVFGGLFLHYSLDIELNIVFPVVLILGAIYLTLHEFFDIKDRSGIELMEDASKEIEDEREGL